MGPKKWVTRNYLAYTFADLLLTNDQINEWLTKILGRPIASLKDLTKSEARAALKALIDVSDAPKLILIKGWRN